MKPAIAVPVFALFFVGLAPGQGARTTSNDSTITVSSASPLDVENTGQDPNAIFNCSSSRKTCTTPPPASTSMYITLNGAPYGGGPVDVGSKWSLTMKPHSVRISSAGAGAPVTVATTGTGNSWKPHPSDVKNPKKMRHSNEGKVTAIVLKVNGQKDRIMCGPNDAKCSFKICIGSLCQP